ncbi:hypothetical protein [Sporolactobacillus laevolacticus]|uniref:Uncharacterized protein n=1 Tax=Sporolactobacillus laevolacticus DSM 442 TaxID=1395513 RepID=V6IV36_9BACL|nr:hypothetical protein [Sporolactobacillus laevolacticus]EST10940.1 hypothetical protein P343_14930 [Sporolactobacillus laevolacticus DSM 442]
MIDNFPIFSNSVVVHDIPVVAKDNSVFIEKNPVDIQNNPVVTENNPVITYFPTKFPTKSSSYFLYSVYRSA